MGKKSSGGVSQITGYKYSMSVHMGIARGPIDVLKEIKVGDLVAWSGNVISSGFQSIDKANLFGGNEKEGGIVGTFKLFMGEPTQTIDSTITDQMEGGFPVPGWRGVTTLFYYGQIGSNNPYPKAWRIRASRTSKGWDNDSCWYPALVKIPLNSNPIVLLSFTRNPETGDALIIGEHEVSFLDGGSFPNVQIEAEAADTVSNFADMLNANSAFFYDVVAVAIGTNVQLQFSGSIYVAEIRGSFVSIGQQGGAIDAMNPAHIIYECATNNVWGRGLPASLIDEDSFSEAADTLAAEGFGLCLRWNRQEDIDKFVQTVVSHIGAAVYFDQQTGLMTLKLIRDDYDPDALVVYTFENGIIDIIEDQISSSDTSYNEVIVKYIDPISGKKGQVRAQNLASFQSLGTLVSTTVEYLGCPTAALATRLAQRDLQMNSGDIRRMKIRFSRAGWDIKPGGVFRINVPTRGISNMVMRAGNIEDGPLTDETILVTAVQDVFSLPTTSFVTPQPSFWVPPSRTPRVIDVYDLTEVTYFDLALNVPPSEVALIEMDTGFLKVFAENPGGANVDYVVYNHASGETEFADRAIAGFDSNARLSADIGHYTTAITMENIKSPEYIVAGQPIRIDDEYCRIDAVDTIAGTMTIARGCIDTIPTPHDEGSVIWFQTHTPTVDWRDYSTGEDLTVKLLSRTTSDRLDPSLAPTDIVEIGGRQGRPYPPGNVTVNTVPFGDASFIPGAETVIAWAHRDRIIQSNVLLEHGVGSTGPEIGTTYTVRVYDGATGLTLLRTVSGITGTTWTHDATMRTADGGTSWWYELESVRDSLVSWQKYRFKISAGGFDFGFDKNFDGAI